MKIPKLFKKATAFVMAAVTALSIMPATAFAAGDIGTISFSHTYDSKGNAMRYNSSANIGDYTAGGTGNYKYRMFVDGENAFCIQPGVPLKTGNTLKKASSDTWNALSANQKKAVAMMGFVKYNGMTAEQFVWAWIKSEFLIPKKLMFLPSNLYYEALKQNIEAREKGLPVAQKKQKRQTAKAEKKKPRKSKKRKEADYDKNA